MQTSVNGTPHQNLAQASAPTFNSACQASNAKARHGIARQFFTFRFTELLNAYLCCAERVKTQYLARCRVINQNKNGANAFCILLRGVLVQELIKSRHAAMKGGTVVQADIKNLLFKHV